MQLTPDATNRLVDYCGASLDGGALAFFEAASDGQSVLAWVNFPTPAFQPAVDGIALAYELPSALIALTGNAKVARFVGTSGETVATLTVRAADAPDADDADVVLERTDFHRGGLVTIARVVLRLPRSV